LTHIGPRGITDEVIRKHFSWAADDIVFAAPPGPEHPVGLSLKFERPLSFGGV
jgi:hypothetical protein